MSHGHFFLSNPNSGFPAGVGRGAGLGFSCWAKAVTVASTSVRANSEILAVSFIACTPSSPFGFQYKALFELNQE
jgi:hypothetical protein